MMLLLTKLKHKYITNSDMHNKLQINIYVHNSVPMQ